MIPAQKSELAIEMQIVDTLNHEENHDAGISETVSSYLSLAVDNLQAIPREIRARLGSVNTENTPTDAAANTDTGFPRFHLQVMQEYLARAQGCLQAVPDNLRGVAQFCQENKEMILKAGAAVLLVGAIIACSTGAATCSQFDIVNDTGDTFTISRLSPYGTKFTDASSKTHDNHPTWYPKGFLENGMVSITKGYGEEVTVRLDKTYEWDNYFYLHLNTNGKLEDFSVEDTSKYHFESVKMGFFACKVNLVDGPQPTSTSTTNTSQSLSSISDTDTYYLRGSLG